jgi:diguanylate cyclase (GGDEF)-like protein
LRIAAARTETRIPPDQRDRALINEAAALLAADRAPRELFEHLCEMLARFVDASVCFVALRDGETLRMQYIHDHGQIRRDPPDIALDPESRSWLTLRSGKPILYRQRADWDGLPRYPINSDRPWTDDSVSAIFVPMEAYGEKLGVLSVQSTASFVYDENDVTLLEAIARYLAIAVRNQQLFERVKHLRDIDPVTGLYNHSRVLESIEDRLRDLGDDRLMIATFDITNFGRINDTHGSSKGDKVLALVAERLRTLYDADTIVGRFGGDDFVVVAQRAGDADIGRIIGEIEARLRGLSYRAGGTDYPISINCGYVVAPNEGRLRASLLALADLRVRLSMQAGGIFVGRDVEELRTHGDFRGIEPIIETALSQDPYSRLHLIHVNRLANDWMPRLGFTGDDEVEFLRASLLHDIGKMLIPQTIVLKPASLTRDEYATMKRHAEYGAAILSAQPGYARTAEIVGQHHEFFGGGGYPNNVAGDAIHPVARAVSIIDAFSAMTIDRPYHLGIPEAAALDEIARCAGTQFDPAYAASFIAFRRTPG